MASIDSTGAGPAGAVVPTSEEDAGGVPAAVSVTVSPETGFPGKGCGVASGTAAGSDAGATVVTGSTAAGNELVAAGGTGSGGFAAKIGFSRITSFIPGLTCFASSSMSGFFRRMQP